MEHEELVAAPAHHGVRPADALAQDLSHALQDAIAGVVAELVVHRLHAVQVDRNRRDARLAAAAAAVVENPLHRVVQRAAVAEPRERIGERHLFELAVGALQCVRVSFDLARTIAHLGFQVLPVARFAGERTAMRDPRPGDQREHEQRGECIRPARSPRRRIDVHVDGETPLVPDAVGIRRLHAQDVTPFAQIRVGDRSSDAGLDPVAFRDSRAGSGRCSRSGRRNRAPRTRR